MKTVMLNDEPVNVFGRTNENNNVDVLYETGEPVTRVADWSNYYPVNSQLSCAYEHPKGIELSLDDAKKLGLDVE